MRNVFILLTICLVIVSIVFAGCADDTREDDREVVTDDQTEITSPVQPEEYETVDADEVETEVDLGFLQDYKDWELVISHHIGPAHMNAIGDVYVNSVGTGMFKSDTGTFPAGAIIVKENYINEDNEKGDLMSLTTMIKKEPGYDPENGNWAYVETGPDGEIKNQGKVQMCIDCHTQVKDKDFVFLRGSD